MAVCPRCGAENSPGAIACFSCNTLIGQGGGANPPAGQNDTVNLQAAQDDNMNLPTDQNNIMSPSVVQNSTGLPMEQGYASNEHRVFKANPKIAEDSYCKICTKKIEVGDDIVQCEKCLSYYHKMCFENNNGCNQIACSEEETKTCPYCRSQIKKSALKCRFCGKYLDSQLVNHQEVLHKGQHPDATYALVFGILSIFCCAIIFGTLAIIKGNNVVRDTTNDPGLTGKGMGQAGRILGIIGLVLWGIGIISRLI